MTQKKKGGLFAGVITGILMVIIGTGLLWWNEGNNVRNIKTTDEIEEKVVEITPDSKPEDNEGKLVAMGGSFVVEDESLSDDEFNVKVHTAALTRVVEIYQWEEDSDTDDDGDTSYSYEAKWHEGLIDSSNFHNSSYKNPTSVAYDSRSSLAENVILGNYRLSSAQIGQMDTDVTMELSGAELALPEGYIRKGQYVTNSSDLDNPKVGDIRISWKYNGWKEVSVISKVSGHSFVAFTSEAGKSVNYVTGGVHTAAEMIQDMRNQDKMLKWILRLVGALLIFFGYLSFISPLTKLVGYIPILGNVVNFMFGLIIFLLALVHSLLVIIIAWFRYRPVLSICLLAAAAVITVLIFVLRKKKPAQQNTAAAV